MSDIVVNVTNAGAANVAVSNGSTVNAVVGSGGSVNVSLGSISPGNATVVSGTLTINSTTTLAAGTPAYVANNGTAYAAKLDIGIPAGPATNVVVGKVSTLSASSNATVTGTANGSTLTLDFGIPAGQGGSNGTAGVNGVTPSFAIGNVSTLAAGSTANVTLTATNGGANVTLDFGLPRGADGNGTGSNLTLSNATPANLGTPAAGASNAAARADHVHQLPQLVSSLNGLAGGVNLVAGANITITAGSSNLTIAAAGGGGLAANAAIDGGFYVGVVPEIIFTLQPQSQNLTVTANVELSSNAVNFTPLANATSYATFSGNYLAQRYYPGWRGILTTADNGVTWSQAINVPSSASAYSPIYASGNGTRTVIASGLSSNGSGMYYVDGTNVAAAVEITSANVTPYAWSGIGPFRTSFATYNPAAGFWIAARQGNFNGLWVQVYKSVDGVTWIPTAALPYNGGGVVNVYGIHVLGNYFAIIGEAWYGPFKAVVALSTDGVNWTIGESNFQNTGASASDSARIVVLNMTTQLEVGVTYDGINWTYAALPFKCTSLYYGDGLFWAWDDGRYSQQYSPSTLVL